MHAGAAFGDILDSLIAAYRRDVRDLDTIERCMLRDGVITDPRQLVNDHIAFRTFGTARLGIAALETLFVHHGYVRRDAYHFVAKHLDAYWYHPPIDGWPRIFISELRMDELPPNCVQTLRRYTDRVAHAPFEAVELHDSVAVVEALQLPHWPMPSAGDVRSIQAESEYAAWTLVNAYRLNHMTLSVHGLHPDYQSIEALNPYLETCGITLNAAGGKIKLSPDGLLVQSSTVATAVDVTFADGVTMPVAGPYVEFAERRVLPEYACVPVADLRREHRRDGFEAANADRIFESTSLAVHPPK